jgi:formate dehydrogenase assembly factor FdhD
MQSGGILTIKKHTILTAEREINKMQMVGKKTAGLHLYKFLTFKVKIF